MSISLNANFELLSAGLYLDARQQFNTIIEMKDFAETSIPDGFITYNKETQKHYVFSSSNTIDATLGKWREYNSGDSSSTTYATWNSDIDYKVGNVVLKDEVRYSCIADHTSTDFETDSINWVVVLEQYYHVTQEQYNKMVSDGLITDSTKDLYIIDGNNEGGNSSSANYTSLEALGLTAPVSVGEIFNAMPDNTMAVLACEAKDDTEGTVNISDIPESFGVLTIKKNELGRFSIDYQNSLQSSACNVKRWIGTLKGLDGTGLIWKLVSTEPTYVALSDIGLTADATIQDVVDALPKGGSALLSVTEFTNYQTIFPYEEGNDQFARVHIVKGTADGSRMYARWFRKDGTKEAIAIFNINNNKFDGWRLLKNQQTYTSLSQLGLTADATIDDVVSTLKDGETALITTNEFTDYLTMFPNYCTNDQYAILKVEKKNANRCFIEWRQKEGYAYAIAGLNSNNRFTNWGNIVRFKKDGFADDSIVCIGDTVSANGVVQTLESLGFSTDILMWENGVYRVSHFDGLINLPSVLDTINRPAFRLEHHNLVKNNVNPNNSTYAPRHSIIYCDNGDIYCRFYKSGATAGVYVNDTGWQQIITENSKTDPYSCTSYTVLTGTEDLFTLPCGHYATTKADKAYNYPITDSSSLTAHIYVLGCLNDPANNKGYRIILYFDNKNRMYRINEWWGSFSNGWQEIQTGNTKATAPFNSKTFKIDITKGNPNWNGNMKFGYCVDNSYGEIIISSLGTTNVTWDCSTGIRYVKSVTYTIDPDNKAHITIGVELNEIVYGIHQLETCGDFATINSVTSDAFTGTSVATRSTTRGRNNGVGILCEVEDLGLTFPCTTVQIAQKMRDLSAGVGRIPSNGMIGIFNNGDKTITDAPTTFGLLEIKAYGYDRLMIRYDGITGNNYNGSWIGKIKGSNGKFSSVEWERIDGRITTLETQVSELFQSVSSGKTLVANAITGKGVSTSTSATFATMATNIGKITNYTASEKQALATAITNKGVSTSSTATFATMATNVGKIPQTITWQEETVTGTRNPDTRIVRFVFSNTVLGITQMTAPGYNYTAEATELKMFTISGNTVEVKAESGTWKMTAMVRVAQ